MASRLGWLGLGVTIGSIATIKIEKAIRRKIKAISPDSVFHNVSKEVSKVSEDLISSLREGLHVVQQENLRSLTYVNGRGEDKITKFMTQVNFPKVSGEDNSGATSRSKYLEAVETRETRGRRLVR